jgi:hypothetical protein
MYPSGKHASVFGRTGSWPTDYPKADRQFVQGVRRLTRIHTRSSEQVVDLDSDEVFNWPWLYAVEMGHSNLTDAECAKLREYLLRGGFFMCDDFHGSGEWNVFLESIQRVFPAFSSLCISAYPTSFKILVAIPSGPKDVPPSLVK